ncbi:MAG: biotin synthase BioB [Planctomycetota bacterium]
MQTTEALSFYADLAEQALQDTPPSPEVAEQLLTDPDVELLPLLHAAFTVRKHYFGLGVQAHVLNNAQNGACPEDCSYCSQRKGTDVPIESYGLKSEAEVLAEADAAVANGAFRYCLVVSGRGPTESRANRLAGLVRAVKDRHPGLEVCVSCGLLDNGKADILADAGVDRLNHNLNTAKGRYASICTTHTYEDRVNTLESAKAAGMQLCSGLIVGMGEQPGELVELAFALRELGASSIPVNFLLPFEGGQLRPAGLSPQYALRILCMVRLVCPRAELRIAAGREMHLGALEPMALYAANSLFLGGYLNAKGEESKHVRRMLDDAGFHLVEASATPGTPATPATPGSSTAPASGPGSSSAGSDSERVDQSEPASCDASSGCCDGEKLAELKTVEELRPARV